MPDFYDSNMIIEILRVFKVNNLVISNVANKNLIDDIRRCDFNLTLINVDDENSITGNPLSILPELINYDAIFIDGDANWYTVFNELNIVKNSNEEFPLVFVCNNIFPNKRRDSYIDPEAIPPEFRQKFTKELPIKYNDEIINIVDDYFHACDENTPRNGVLTAIEDFLSENSHVGIMKINFLDGITVLYPKLQINEKRISIINNNIQSEKTDKISLSDKLVENDLLVSYINKYNEYGENFNKFEEELSKKDNLIANYENEIFLKNREISIKDSQVKNIESKLSLKDSQIKNAESKLVNSEKKIDALEGQLESASNDFSQRENSFNDKIDALENQLESASNDFSQRESSFNDKIVSLEDQLNSANSEFSRMESSFNDKIVSLEDQLNSANSEFSQKESIFNNKLISLENKLNRKNDDYETLFSDIKQKDNQIKQKDNQIKIKQQELNDVENKLDNLQHRYTKQLSKLDSNRYCINCFKEEISNNGLEIEYLKNNTLIKKILSPVSYLYLILKSNPKELSLNLKLYRAIKDSNCFDIGFYLNKNKDLIGSKWCKYFSPELHYVCQGFSEDRLFNKKYFNRNSKEELLDYLLTCDK